MSHLIVFSGNATKINAEGKKKNHLQNALLNMIESAESVTEKSRNSGAGRASTPELLADTVLATTEKLNTVVMPRRISQIGLGTWV
jgi:hypothetical protein